ncbi:MAG: hypothetical protein R3C26_18490 [Calditrichia bacterium]
MATLTRFANHRCHFILRADPNKSSRAQDYDTGIYYSDDYEYQDYDDYDEYPPIVVYRYGVF